MLTGDFIGVMDGSILGRERPSDDAWQRANYNGKSNRDAMKVLLVQLFDGTFAAAVVNFPGGGHDAKLASFLNVGEAMQHLHPRFKLACDTAFATSSRVVQPLS